MKIDSKQPGSGIYGVCTHCLKKALRLPENKFKEKIGVPSYVQAECDICHKVDAVAPVAEYQYPIFEVKRRLNFDDLLREIHTSSPQTA